MKASCCRCCSEHERLSPSPQGTRHRALFLHELRSSGGGSEVSAGISGGRIGDGSSHSTGPMELSCNFIHSLSVFGPSVLQIMFNHLCLQLSLWFQVSWKDFQRHWGYGKSREIVVYGCLLVQMKGIKASRCATPLVWDQCGSERLACPRYCALVQDNGSYLFKRLCWTHTLSLWKSLMMEARLNDYVRVLSVMHLWVYSEGSKHMPIKHGENYQWMFLNDQ